MSNMTCWDHQRQALVAPVQRPMWDSPQSWRHQHMGCNAEFCGVPYTQKPAAQGVRSVSLGNWGALKV
eukprot:1158222-Pelagomonas_calceolata.AAC.3